MKFKKIAAIFMVATMTASPLTAFAADSATGSGTIEGYVVEAAFSVVLPTTTGSSLAFVLDPQALLAVSNDTDYSGEAAGSIIFTSTKSTSSPVIYATNKSSYPVLLDVDVTMTNDATNPVTFVTDKTKVDEAKDTALNVYFAAIPEQLYTDVSDYTTSVPSTKVALPIDPTTLGSKLAYSVDGSKDNYEITYVDPDYLYTPIAAPTWDSVGFTLTGSCNKDANWDAYNTANGALSCEVAWTMTKPDANSTLTPYEIATVPVGDDAYGLVDLVTVTPTAPAIATTTYALTASTAVAVPVTLGLGTKAATGIASVTYNDGTVKTVDPADYTFASNTLTFKSAYVDTLIAASVASRAYTVTFNDTAATPVVVTLTYTAPIAEVLPSIATTTYAIDADTAKAITVALGAGTGTATGIESIKIGSTALTPTTDYTISGTTLTLTAAYVNAQIAATDKASRTLVVTFNNTAKTVVNLTITYTAPVVNRVGSVTPTDVTFSKVSGATVAIDLGSGTGVVTGITSVATVVAGVDYPWTATTHWSLSGTTLTLKPACSLGTLATGLTRTVKVYFNNGTSDTFIATVAN